ncbi:MAG: hypothetical protein RR657_03870, partial [Peptostreptococcaceae bacterium]
SMFKEEVEILNMKAVICLLNKNLDYCETLLKKSWILDNNNFNTIFNIAYLKELSGNEKEAIRFYTKIIKSCENKEVILEAKEKLEKLTFKYDEKE